MAKKKTALTESLALDIHHSAISHIYLAALMEDKSRAEAALAHAEVHNRPHRTPREH
jgi:hypothetical protein